MSTIQVHCVTGDPKIIMSHIFVSVKIRVAKLLVKVRNIKIHKILWKQEYKRSWLKIMMKMRKNNFRWKYSAYI